MTNKVTESHRATLRCKYMGNSGRISVQRYENTSNGRDPNRTVVNWQYALSIAENYNYAVQAYLNDAQWVGHWVTSTITDGAVAVCIDNAIND